VSCSIRNSKIC